MLKELLKDEVKPVEKERSMGSSGGGSAGSADKKTAEEVIVVQLWKHNGAVYGC